MGSSPVGEAALSNRGGFDVSTTTVDQGIDDAPTALPERSLTEGRVQGLPAAQIQPARKKSFMERVEAYISRLSTRSNFWHRVCSLIWLPIAYRSGIKVRRLDKTTFTAVLPFRRFNRNWYNAMAGAALLANSEIAGGMYVFGVCGGDYTVVCKELRYKFLRPCFGPAVYRANPQGDLHALVEQGGEFNIDIELEICQQLKKPGDREFRVGRCHATFHVTPKSHAKAKRNARRDRKKKAHQRQDAGASE